jgi:hypothetical protein
MVFLDMAPGQRKAPLRGDSGASVILSVYWKVAKNASSCSMWAALAAASTKLASKLLRAS